MCNKLKKQGDIRKANIKIETFCSAKAFLWITGSITIALSVFELCFADKDILYIMCLIGVTLAFVGCVLHLLGNKKKEQVIRNTLNCKCSNTKDC